MEFYYVWKKTESANSQRPRQRQRRPPTNILRVKKSKGNGGKQIRPTFNEFCMKLLKMYMHLLH